MHVKSETVTVVQKFVRSRGSRAQVLRVLRDSSGTLRRFLLTNRTAYNDTSSSSTTADIPETRIALALEFASSARRVEIEELAPTRFGTFMSQAPLKTPTNVSHVLGEDAKHLAAQQKSAEAAQQILESTWGETSSAVEAIYNVLCARGRFGADALRGPMLRAEMHAGIMRGSSSARVHSSGKPVPLVPLKLAADFMLNEDGALILLQIKRVVWGPPQAKKQ